MNFKSIPNEYFITILDRLTRFEPAFVRYERVFGDIISKFSHENVKNLNLDEQISLCENIINNTLKINFEDDYINKLLMDLEEKYFTFNQISYQYLSARLNISGMLDKIELSNKLPKNVYWLKKIYQEKDDVISLRNRDSLLYPIEKIVLCEGQTEYTLLESIFKLFNYDFSKMGIKVLPAGGKNQVARKFYQMLEYTKIPFFILLDKDAEPIKEMINSKIRPIDKVYVLESGEFEDLIPRNILQNTINYVHSSELNCIWDDFDTNLSMVNNLEFIYRKYGFGEFKKAQFAQELCKYINENCNMTNFESTEIVDILISLQE